ncbi:hypothetical protein BGZ76_004774 [Entomortierella beljakovae]|nr:hypothetical protein BGZ76_004774 [Entomortierella beljakovae]
MGLKFEKSRTNSSDSVDHKRRETTTHQNNHHYQHEIGERSSTPRQYHYSSHFSQFNNGSSNQDDIVPEYDPLIFDQLQLDNNESYILWRSSPDIVPYQPSTTESVPATPVSSSSSSNKYLGGVNPLTTGEAVNPSSSKDKGRDSLEIDRAHGQHKFIEGATPEVSKSSLSSSNTNANTMDNTSACPTSPTSPGFSKPLERLSGTIAMIRPGGLTVINPTSKGNASPVQASIQNSISNPTEDRVIMAASVEKLVEKLTIDIDYTFLTDFFLIYRLFISPIALLKLLLARFKWALIENTPQRQVVRVRTFVTMRHWLLNYFEYDFMNSKVLRRTHVKSLRELADHPIVRTSVRDKRIIKELRQLYHLKRKSHCREMAQLALERPSTGQTDEPSHRSPLHRRTTNLVTYVYNVHTTYDVASFVLEWIQSAAASSKRSSADTSDLRQAHHQRTGSLNLTSNRRSMGDNEGYFGDESTDNESELSSADGQDDGGDDIYEEEAHFVIPGNRQTYRDISDDETEDSELEDEDDSNDGHDSSGQLPSPAFSASSPKKTETDFVSPVMADNGADTHYSRNSQEYPDQHYSPDHHHSYHHRRQTTPRALDTRIFPRPLFCGDDSSSQFALSPPESPRLLEPYMNPPPRSIASVEKKKTWSHYMAATAEQLSKVKRALLPKASPSFQDLRHHSISSTSSQTFLMNQGQTGNSISRGSSQEITSGSSTQFAGTNQWNVDERQYSGNGASKSMQQPTSLNTNTGTNSAVSSLDGRWLHGDKGGDKGVLSSEWSSDEEDLPLEHYSQKERDSVGYDQACEQSRNSTPTRSKRHSLPLDEVTVAAATNAETMYQGRQTSNWDEPDEEEEDQDTQGEEDFLKSQTADQFINGRALRRTTQKRDKRASWMTFSSTNSSVFGAVLSQGHLPPSQTIRDKNDIGNVDRFMERFYHDQSSSTNNSSSETGPDPRRNGARRKSTDAIQEKAIRDMAISRSPLNDGNAIGDLSEKIANENCNGKPGIGVRRNHTLAQHPHRQTVPIMHHHYHHHHYLQHRQSESLLLGFPSQRRHSVEVQSLAWRNSQQKERKTFQEITPVSPPSTKTLLEGAAYAAALQESQRMVKMMNSQENQTPKKVVQAPQVLPHPPGRPIGPGRARPLASLSTNSALQMYQPSIDQTRSSSDPQLLHMPDWEVTSPTSTISIASTSSTATRGAIPGAVGAYKTYSPIYPLNQGVPFAQQLQQQQQQHHHHHSHSHEDSYNQQRSPMNPRFQSILSINRDSPRPRPTSVVLRYSPELIAQQLCLIEREQLNQVLWHELVNAGWKKKPQEETVPEPEFSSATESSLCAVAIALAVQNGDGDGDRDLNPHASPPISSRRPWPLSRSQTSKTHMQRFPDQSHTFDSPNVTQLVDRFNLMCRWVTSEILKTIDLDQRVKVVERFIRIAQTCYNHSNFSSLTQIMVGLQVFEVSRLHRTWARVQPAEKKMMQDLTEFTSMSRNWKHIRNAMRSISEEWGAAVPSVQEPPPTASISGSTGGGGGGGGSGSGKQQSLNLFSKMTGRDKDKEKEKEKDKEKGQSSQTTNGGGSGSRFISHYHSSSLGKSSSHSMATTNGSVSGHQKTNSGQGFPSLVSSFTKDKSSLAPSEKDKDGKNASGGCIPLLAVYLSDLLYNTELPSFVEPKSIETSPRSSTYHHLPSPPQSATVAPYKATNYHLNSQTPPSPMVNMHKHRTTATIIKRILTFRAMANRYPFVKESDVYGQLFAIEAPDQLELERLSDLCEERVSSGLASPVFAK